MKLTTKILFLGLLLALTLSIVAQEEMRGATIDNLNVRTGPDTSYTRIGRIEAGSDIIIEGRNQRGDWLLVYTPDNSLRGWVASRYVNWQNDLELVRIPVIEAIMTDTTPPAEAAPPPSVDDGAANNAAPVPIDDPFDALVLTNGTWRHIREIYIRGQALGNRPNAFSKLGDSNITMLAMFCPFETGKSSLGDYGYLQPVVGLMNETGSFCRKNITADGRFTTLSEFETIWSDPYYCEPGETPLECEYRVHKPAYAIIYLGLGDMFMLSGDEFYDNMSRIITFWVDNGVIPVLTTIVIAENHSNDMDGFFNDIIRRIAAENDIPLIDLSLATYYFDNRGAGEDGIHLSFNRQEETYLNGEEALFGKPLYELLTLQMLYSIISNLP